MAIGQVIQIWSAAIFTILIYSIAFRDNDLFKFAEYTFLGCAAGHGLVMGVDNIRRYGWNNIMAGKYLYIIAFLLGIILYTRYHSQYFWVSRYPLSVMVGIGIGLSMRSIITAEFIAQIKATASMSLISGSLWKIIQNWIFVILCLSTVYFFIFTIPEAHQGGLGIIPKFARYGMMAAFSYSFANTVLSRYNMIFGRINFLYTEWLPLTGAIIALPVILIALIYAMIRRSKG